MSAAGRRLSVITVDQAIAGASNVLSMVLAARVLGVASFGLFGLLFIVYMMLIGVARGLVADPLLVHPADAEQRPGEVIGTDCVLALTLTAGILVIGAATLLWNAPLGQGLLVLGACLPLLMLQDLGRYIAFATQRPVRAVVLDAAWLVILIAAVAVLLATGARTLIWFVVAWAGSGALAGLLVFWQNSVRSVRVGITWLRDTWSFSWRYLVSYVSTQGAALIASIGVGAVAGARSLGGVQGAALLARPFSTFQQAAIAGNTVEVTRTLSDLRQVRRHVNMTARLTTTVAVLNAVVMLILPERIGVVFLGDSWHAAQPLLLPTAVQIICLGLLTAPRAGLIGMRQIKRVMRADVATTVMVLVATFSGAAADGAKGALWAIDAGQAALVLYWWSSFLMQTGKRQLSAASSTMPAVTVATPPA